MGWKRSRSCVHDECTSLVGATGVIEVSFTEMEVSESVSAGENENKSRFSWVKCVMTQSHESECILWVYFRWQMQKKNRKSKVFNIYIILKSCKIGCNHWVCDILRAKKAEFRALRSVKGVSAKGTEKWGKRRIWGDMGLVYQTRNLFL